MVLHLTKKAISNLFVYSLLKDIISLILNFDVNVLTIIKCINKYLFMICWYGLKYSEQSGNTKGKVHGDPVRIPPTVVQGSLYVPSTVLCDTFINNSSLENVLLKKSSAVGAFCISFDLSPR